jgi:hypothetical protein
VLIAYRIAAHVNSDETEADRLWNIVFPEFVHGVRTQDYIIGRTLRRPRDVIQFCNFAVRNAQRAGHERVGEEDVVAAWDRSGLELLRQIEKEFEVEYPRLGELILFFVGRPAVQSWPVLQKDLEKFVRRVKDPPDWLREGGLNRWLLLAILYDAGIVGLRTEAVQWFGERSVEEMRIASGGNFEVSVHPAFTRHLGCIDA